MQKKGFWYTVKTNRTLLLMLFPPVLFVILFAYIPMAGIGMAFRNFNYIDGIFRSPWVGLENFRFLIISDRLWPLTRNTLLYNLAFIAIGTVVQVAFAVTLSELAGKRLKKIMQSSMILPYLRPFLSAKGTNK